MGLQHYQALPDLSSLSIHIYLGSGFEDHTFGKVGCMVWLQ